MIISPPYTFGYRDGYAYNNGDSGATFDYTADSVADSATGYIATHNINSIGTSGDQSRQTVVTYGDIQLNFQSDFTGSARVLATLKCLDLSFDWGRLRDRSGVSNAYTKQKSTLQIWRPGFIDGNSARFTLVDLAVTSDGENREWGPWPHARKGDVFTFEYIPNTSFTSGQSALLEIQIGEEQYGGINDMSFVGEIANYYSIKQVEVKPFG